MFKPIHNEDYTVKVDDSCILVKCGKSKVWLSPKLLNWLKENAETFLNENKGETNSTDSLGEEQ